MNTKRRILFILTSLGGLMVMLCSCGQSTIITGGTTQGSNEINSTSLIGHIKGTMAAGETYTINGDIYVNAADTLLVKPGATINVLNDATFFINGTILAMGTQANPITFTSPANTPGSWGGFQCDSAKAVTFHWTHINYTGGASPTGKPRVSILVHAPINVDIEDSWILDGLDDGIDVNDGAKLTLLRNTIMHQGSTDGEGENTYRGVTGTIAYNVIWGGAGYSFKINTDNLQLYPQTDLKIYNNTMVANGFRRGAAEPGGGILIDQFARAEIYNNLFVDDYYGMNINPAADTSNMKYGNNYFYSDIDSLRAYYYVPGSYGKPQPSDIISASTSSKQPMFLSYSKNISAQTDNNDYHLQPGSPAIDAGNPLYNSDIGAYTTDGKGNKH